MAGDAAARILLAALLRDLVNTNAQAAAHCGASADDRAHATGLALVRLSPLLVHLVALAQADPARLLHALRNDPRARHLLEPPPVSN